MIKLQKKALKDFELWFEGSGAETTLDLQTVKPYKVESFYYLSSSLQIGVYLQFFYKARRMEVVNYIVRMLQTLSNEGRDIKDLYDKILKESSNLYNL